MSAQDKVKLFAKLAKEVAGDKTEAEMTDEEWKQVELKAATPF